jgi:hypothetical protein
MQNQFCQACPLCRRSAILKKEYTLQISVLGRGWIFFWSEKTKYPALKPEKRDMPLSDLRAVTGGNDF